MSETNLENFDDITDVVERAVMPVSDKPKSTNRVAPSELPQSVTESLNNPQSPLGTDQVAEERAKVDQRVAQRATQRNVEKLERQARLRELKSNPKAVESAADFLAEMAGIRPFVRSYQRMGFIHVTFQAVDSDISDEIYQQNVRNVVMGRLKFTTESQLYQPYRLAGSLVRLEIRDPQSPESIYRVYDRQASRDDVLKYSHPDIQDSDLWVHRAATYLLHEMIPSGTMYREIVSELTNFETILDDMTFLCGEDPDFFRKCLPGGPSQG